MWMIFAINFAIKAAVLVDTSLFFYGNAAERVALALNSLRAIKESVP